MFRAGTAETGAGNLGQVRRDSQALMNELCAASSMGPLHGAFALPVLLQGANGQFQVMHQLAVGTAASQQQQQQPGWPVRVSPAFLELNLAGDFPLMCFHDAQRPLYPAHHAHSPSHSAEVPLVHKASCQHCNP